MTYMDRVLSAVNDTEWQAFRVSMKGKPTPVKLDMLRDYWEAWHDSYGLATSAANKDCVYCIRVDNYLKALCRGGQLHPGESLQTTLDDNWQIRIRR